MFNKLLINNDMDIGQIAESLLFYNKVDIIFSEKGINRLFEQVHPNIFLPFVKEHKDKIRMHYYNSSLGLSTYGSDTENFYMKIMLEEEVDNSPYIKYLETNLILPQQTGSKADKRITRDFLDLLKVEYNSQYKLNKIVKEINSNDYFKNYLINNLKFKNANYSLSDLEFNLIKKKNNEYKISSNINKDVLTKLGLDENYLMYFLYNYINDLLNIMECAKYKSDIFTDSFNSNLLNLRGKDLLRKKIKNPLEVPEIFQNEVIENARTIKEVINSGEKSFKEFIPIYEKSLDFKKWLNSVNEDKKLIDEYYKKTIDNTWADNIPIKSIRWMCFTGIETIVGLFGPLGIIASIGLSFVDNFIINAIVNGWKPDQFVEKDLKRFCN